MAPVFALLAGAYLMTGCVYRLYADPPLVTCQITTPAQCDPFTRVPCTDTDPGYEVYWEEQFEDGVSIGWKPFFEVGSCAAATETVSIDMGDEVQCGGQVDGGTHVQENVESHKVCWVTRWCAATAVEQGGPPVVTLNWRTGPDGGGNPINTRWETLNAHFCQPITVDPGDLLPTDIKTNLDWFKCVPYSNCR